MRIMQEYLDRWAADGLGQPGAAQTRSTNFHASIDENNVNEGEQLDIRAIFVDDNVSEIMEIGQHPHILRVLFVRGVD